MDEMLINISEVIENLNLRLIKIEEYLQAPRTSSTCIYDLGNDGLELLVPIFIRLEEWEDEVIASWPELNLFASADTEYEAIHDLKQEIISLYYELQINEPISLGPLPKQWYYTLCSVIKKAKT